MRVEGLARRVLFHPPSWHAGQSMIRKSGYRFSAFAKPASAGEGRSEKIMLHDKR